MAGEVFGGVAVFMIILIVLLGGWLSSKMAKESGHVPPERVPVVGDKSVLKEPVITTQPFGVDKMTIAVTERKPLQQRVQIVKARPSTTGARQDSSYGYPTIDTFDYHEPVRSTPSVSYGGGGCSGGGSSSSSDSGSGGCD